MYRNLFFYNIWIINPHQLWNFDVESYPCGDEIDDPLESRGQSDEVEIFTEGGYTSQTYWY
jgi:hypothetical protein